jgi:hypothetical protein
VGLLHRPLFHLLFGFISGIVIGRHLSPEPVIFYVLAFFSCVLLFFLLVQGRKTWFLPLVVFVLIGIVASTRIPDPDRPPRAIQKLLPAKKQAYLELDILQRR